MAGLAVSALNVNMQEMKVRFTVFETRCIVNFLFKDYLLIMAVETKCIVINIKICGKFTSKFRPQELSVFRSMRQVALGTVIGMNRPVPEFGAVYLFFHIFMA